ncbi:MAG TPA: serine/threonine-protein kinase, partial [Polyangia bacterium]|nr:serine/threonine-protein kinase [Polyangia bacterium]
MSAANIVGTGAFDAELVGGRYRLQGALGRGSEGESFSALDEREQRRVAVKLFDAATPAVAARVRFEFERLVALDHPSLVRVLDVGRHGARPFLVTALVDGDDLTSIARQVDDDQRRRAFESLASDLTDALACLHARGIVHGDVAPANIRLTAGGRAVLMDLGATAYPSTGGATGTLGFAAPEALVGALSPAADLFGLGATLFFAWTGQPPFGQGVDAVARTLAGEPAKLSSLRAGLSPGWDQLIAELLGPTPTDRPSSSRQVLLRLAGLGAAAPPASPGLLPPHPAGDPLSGIFVGRAAELAALDSALAALAEGSVRHSVIALVGAEGAGRRALLDVCLQRHAIRQLGGTEPSIELFRGSVPTLARWLACGPTDPDEAGDVDPEQGRHRKFARLVAALEARATRVPVCVVLEASSDDGAFAAFFAGAPPSGRVLVLLPTNQSIGRIGATDLGIGPLSRQDLATMVARALGEMPSDAPVARIFDVSAGHAATTVHLVRQLVIAHREGAAERFVPRSDAGLDDLLTSNWAAMPAAARRWVVTVALELAGLDADARSAEVQARAAGWVTGDPLHPQLPSAAHRAVVLRALASDDLRDLTSGALAPPPAGLPITDGRRGVCLAALGETAQAVLAFRRAAEALPDDEAMACEWLARAEAMVPAALSADEGIRLANQMALQGRHEEAARTLLAGGDAAAH